LQASKIITCCLGLPTPVSSSGRNSVCESGWTETSEMEKVPVLGLQEPVLKDWWAKSKPKEISTN